MLDTVQTFLVRKHLEIPKLSNLLHFTLVYPTLALLLLLGRGFPSVEGLPIDVLLHFI